MIRRPRITPIADYKDYVVIENITVLHQSPNPQERGEKTYLKDATLSGQLVTMQFNGEQPKERIMIGNINDGYSLLPTDALKEKKAETAIEEVLAMKDSDETFLKLSKKQTILAAVALLGLIILIK